MNVVAPERRRVGPKGNIWCLFDSIVVCERKSIQITFSSEEEVAEAKDNPAELIQAQPRYEHCTKIMHFASTSDLGKDRIHRQLNMSMWGVRGKDTQAGAFISTLSTSLTGDLIVNGSSHRMSSVLLLGHYKTGTLGHMTHFLSTVDSQENSSGNGFINN